MIVGTLQYDVQYYKQRENLAIIENYLQTNHLDLLVLPELCTTGILFQYKEDIAAMAEQIPYGETTGTFIKLAITHQTAIIATILEKENETYFVTSVVVDKNGYVGKQRKRHLTKGESGIFSPADRVRIFEICGIKVGVIICFDVWFPETCRELILQGAQIICHPANIMSATSMDIVRLRAIENNTPIICSNRIGRETKGDIVWSFLGESKIIDSNGNIVAEAGTGEELIKHDFDFKNQRKKSLNDCDDLIHEIKLHTDYYR